MSYRNLPYFERGIDADQIRAKQDRILIDVGDWFFEGDDTEFQQLLMALIETRYSLGDDSEIEGCQLFCRRQSRQRHNGYLDFRERPQSRNGGPLFGGSLRYVRQRGSEFGPSRYKISFELALNPTRALNHQPLHPEIRRGAPVTSYPRTSLQRRSRSFRSAEEIVLDENDNVILDRRTNAMASPEHWCSFRNAYLEAVFTFLNGLIWSAFEDLNLPVGGLSSAPGFNLKEIETYWEFRADDPIHVVRRMEQHFHCLGTTTNIRRFRNLFSQTEFANHSPVLISEFVTGVRVKVYAKTTRRIRVEVKRDRSFRSPHTFTSASDLISHIDHIAELDAREAQMFLETIERAIPEDVSQRPPYELIRQIFSASPDRIVQATLLSLLVNNNGIALPARQNEFSEPVRLLHRLGILERSRRSSRFFRLSEQYQNARRRLYGSL